MPNVAKTILKFHMLKIKKSTVFSFLLFSLTNSVPFHICSLDMLYLGLVVSGGCHFRSLRQMKSF